MPQVSRFYGITIHIFVERGERHHLPHFHVNYQDYDAAYSMEPIELLSGSLPLRQRRLVEVWAELHHHELLENWLRLQNDQPCKRIAPLE